MLINEIKIISSINLNKHIKFAMQAKTCGCEFLSKFKKKQFLLKKNIRKQFIAIIRNLNVCGILQKLLILLKLPHG